MKTEKAQLMNKTFDPNTSIGSFNLVNIETDTCHQVDFVLSSFGSVEDPKDVVIVSLNSDERQAIVGCPYDQGLMYGWTTVAANTVFKKPPVKDKRLTGFLKQMLPVAQGILSEYRKSQ